MFSTRTFFLVYFFYVSTLHLRGNHAVLAGAAEGAMKKFGENKSRKLASSSPTSPTIKIWRLFLYASDHEPLLSVFLADGGGAATDV